MRRKVICLVLVTGVVLSLLCNLAFAQQAKAFTQELFAVELVKNMKLQDHLPIAALASDCVDLLDNLGISPLKGWDRNALLTEEDYTVIIAKAVGKEGVVYAKSVEICKKNVELINKHWQEHSDLTLSALFDNKDIFPAGRPECPYGLAYKQKGQKKKV